MPTVIDIDKLAPSDKHVKLGGTTYRVPGDPPSRWFLQLQGLAEAATDADESDTDQLRHLQDSITDLFAIRQPNVKDPATAAGKKLAGQLGDLGLVTTMQIVGAIYAGLGDADDDEDGGADPKAGTRNGSRKPKKPSRSTS